jgi:2-methylcitrate dehydratase
MTSQRKEELIFKRNFAWANYERQCRTSIAYRFAQYALGLKYEMLPSEVVRQAKRSLLDSLGCAIGAYDAPGRPICEEFTREFGGPEEATGIGSGMRTSAYNAILLNSFLVRYLDFNDNGGGRHGSDGIAGVLAVSEREKINGRDSLTALVISYELGARLRSCTKNWKGVDPDYRAVLSMPPALGKLMGLNEEQLANAIGICAFGNYALALQDSSEEMVMRKDLRFGWNAAAALQSCMLAKRGFTGPVRVVEAEDGINEVLFQGKMNLEELTDFEDWRILLVRHKYLCGVTPIQGVGGAVLTIVKENNLKPEDIAMVNVKLLHGHPLTVPFRYPRCAESADHNVQYLTAAAIKDRALGPESMQSENFTDPVILDLMEKIKVEEDHSLDLPDEKDRDNMGGNTKTGNDGIAEILTTDGRKFYKHVVGPHGLGDDPLTDKELEDKFRSMASKYMKEDQIRKIIDTVWNVEKLGDMNELMKLMAFKLK